MCPTISIVSAFSSVGFSEYADPAFLFGLDESSTEEDFFSFFFFLNGDVIDFEHYTT